jgi:hypothetical protein
MSRDQVGESGNGILGIKTPSFDSQHRPALSGKAKQVYDAPAVHYHAVAANCDFGLEQLRRFHELVSGSHMEPKDVANSDLTTSDVEVLRHRN